MLTTHVQTQHQIKCHNNREDLVAAQSIKGRNVWNGKYLEGEAIFSAEDWNLCSVERIKGQRFCYLHFSERVLLKHADLVISPPTRKVPKCYAFSLSGASVVTERRKRTKNMIFSGDLQILFYLLSCRTDNKIAVQTLNMGILYQHGQASTS